MINESDHEIEFESNSQNYDLNNNNSTENNYAENQNINNNEYNAQFVQLLNNNQGDNTSKYINSQKYDIDAYNFDNANESGVSEKYLIRDWQNTVSKMDMSFIGSEVKKYASKYQLENEIVNILQQRVIESISSTDYYNFVYKKSEEEKKDINKPLETYIYSKINEEVLGYVVAKELGKLLSKINTIDEKLVYLKELTFDEFIRLIDFTTSNNINELKTVFELKKVAGRIVFEKEKIKQSLGRLSKLFNRLDNEYSESNWVESDWDKISSSPDDILSVKERILKRIASNLIKDEFDERVINTEKQSIKRNELNNDEQQNFSDENTNNENYRWN